MHSFRQLIGWYNYWFMGKCGLFLLSKHARNCDNWYTTRWMLFLPTEGNGGMHAHLGVLMRSLSTAPSCVHAWIHTITHTYIHTYTYVHAYVHTYTECVCIGTQRHICTYIRYIQHKCHTHTCTSMCTHITNTHTCIHAHMYIHITNTQTHMHRHRHIL